MSKNVPIGETCQKFEPTCRFLNRQSVKYHKIEKSIHGIRLILSLGPQWLCYEVQLRSGNSKFTTAYYEKNGSNVMH